MLSQGEIAYLQNLAKEYLEVASSESNNIKKEKWYANNGLKENATPVFMNHYWPVALSEIFDKESYYCKSERGLYFEKYLKTKLFYSTKLNDDNVLEPVIYSPLTLSIENYSGLERKIERSQNDIHSSGAYKIVPVLNRKEDIEKIKLPTIEYDKEASYKTFQETKEIFEPILKVIKAPHTMSAKIADEYSWLRGIEKTYIDMVDNTEWMHKVLSKITKNYISRFKTLESLGIWGTLDQSLPLGSGGLRYIKDTKDYKDIEDTFNHSISLKDSWGSTCAEAFTCVSCDMHDEFSFEYDKKIMNLFKQINVGCCEVLDRKISLCKKLPNTRRISVSEWCNPELAASSIKNNYIFSYRAAGTHFVPDEWNKSDAEKEIRSVLEAIKKHNCNCEIILNIGGQLGKNPRRKVIEWSKLVRNLINEYFPIT